MLHRQCAFIDGAHEQRQNKSVVVENFGAVDDDGFQNLRLGSVFVGQFDKILTYVKCYLCKQIV